jgi:hypothetical protein
MEDNVRKELNEIKRPQTYILATKMTLLQAYSFPL